MAWRREATPCSAPGGVTWARQRLSARAPESLGKPGHRRLRAPAPPFPAPGTSRPVRGRSPGSKGPRLCAFPTHGLSSTLLGPCGLRSIGAVVGESTGDAQPPTPQGQSPPWGSSDAKDSFLRAPAP